MTKGHITINNSDSRLKDPRSHESQELPNGRTNLSKAALSMLLVAVALGAGFVGLKLGARYQINAECCQMPLSRSLVVSAKEKLGLAKFYSQMGQDKWVSEAVFSGVKNGFFLDVGSGDGTFISNTKALEQKGWTGICIDANPRNMQDRTCQIFKEVVSNETGKRVKFWAHPDDWAGIVDTLGDPEAIKDILKTAPLVELTTVTLADILERANAPRFIHYVSMDIEGGELSALKGFPFDKYQIGALTVEHNFEEPRRSEIKALMESHGYKRVHTSVRDDFYVPANPLDRMPPDSQPALLHAEKFQGVVNARSVRVSSQPGCYPRPNRTLP